VCSGCGLVGFPQRDRLVHTRLLGFAERRLDALGVAPRPRKESRVRHIRSGARPPPRRRRRPRRPRSGSRCRSRRSDAAAPAAPACRSARARALDWPGPRGPEPSSRGCTARGFAPPIGSTSPPRRRWSRGGGAPASRARARSSPTKRGARRSPAPSREGAAGGGARRGRSGETSARGARGRPRSIGFAKVEQATVGCAGRARFSHRARRWSPRGSRAEARESERHGDVPGRGRAHRAVAGVRAPSRRRGVCGGPVDRTV